MAIIAANLQAVHRRIAQAIQAAGRAPEAVRLVAVSKTFPAQAIRAAVDAGQTAFGENHEQEGLRKIGELRDLRIEWHFIGPIQSNKTRGIAENFAWVHSVDRAKIAQRLSDARPPGVPPLNVLIQVNVSGEPAKSGVAPEGLLELARQTRRMPGLALRGLMAIPRPTGDEKQQRSQFRVLRELKDSLAQADIALVELSMGMSADMEAAIAEGATMVRIGTGIFGQRAAKETADERR